MNTVEPIREKAKIEEMKNYLKSKNIRDWALFTLGINSGLRISDLLKLNISDVTEEDGTIRDRIYVKEKKTKKSRTFRFNINTINALTEYIATTEDTQIALFASQKGCKAITRQHAWTIINGAAVYAGIKVRVGCHTMRKTWGFMAYEAGIDITRIQAILNHSSPRETLRYIGITQDELDDVIMELNL